jgi:hypothetical protein
MTKTEAEQLAATIPDAWVSPVFADINGTGLFVAVELDTGAFSIVAGNPQVEGEYVVLAPVKKETP